MSEIKIQRFSVIDSTSSYALRLLKENKDDIFSLNKTVITAFEQTAGRGRLNRAFYSPPKTGVYLSLIFVPPEPIKNPALLTATAGAGVCRAISKNFGVEPDIKWVNDIYIEGRKAGGILTEGFVDYKTGTIKAAVVGIGINISTSEFPEELAQKAGAIQKKDGVHYRSVEEEDDFVKAVAKEVFFIYESKEQTKKALEEYKSRSFLTGKKVLVCPVINQNENNYVALVKGISDEAKLIVQTENGAVIELDSGEVSILPQN